MPYSIFTLMFSFHGSWLVGESSYGGDCNFSPTLYFIVLSLSILIPMQ